MMTPLQFLYTSRNSASRATSSDYNTHIFLLKNWIDHRIYKKKKHYTFILITYILDYLNHIKALLLYPLLTPYTISEPFFLNTWQSCDSHLLGLVLQFQIVSTPFAFAWKNKKSAVWSLNELIRKKPHNLQLSYFLRSFLIK